MRKKSVDYIVGIVRNARLSKLLEPQLFQAATEFESSQKKMRRFIWLTYAAESWDKPRQIIGKAVIADLYTQIAKGFVALSNHYTQAAAAYLIGDETVTERWDKAATAAAAAADRLDAYNGAVSFTEKGAEATASGQPVGVYLWTQAARQAQSTSDCYLRLSQSIATGADEAIIEQYKQAAQAADEVLKKLVKDIEADQR